MSMVKCKECGKEISSSANKCPHCGKKKSSLLLKIIGGVLLFAFISGMLGAGKESGVTVESAKQHQQIPEIFINARQLVNEYKANEVAADQKYKGKILEIEGLVYTIGKDITDKMYITFMVGEYEFRSVQCFFDNKYSEKLANLRKGERVVVRGKNRGLMGNVLIKDCEFASEERELYSNDDPLKYCEEVAMVRLAKEDPQKKYNNDESKFICNCLYKSAKNNNIDDIIDFLDNISDINKSVELEKLASSNSTDFKVKKAKQYMKTVEESYMVCSN